MKTNDLMEKITKQIVEDMEKGNLFWDTPWIKSGNFPRNAVSKKIYRGVNIIWLTTIANKKGFTSNLWMTYQQAKTAGGNIKTRTKGTEVIFFKPLTIKGQPDRLPAWSGNGPRPSTQPIPGLRPGPKTVGKGRERGRGF